MKESVIEQRLRLRVRQLGGVAYKFTSPGRRGVPDRLVLLPRQKNFPAEAVFVELKAPGKKPRGEQLREHERLRSLGFRVVVIDSLEALTEFRL